MSDKIGFKNSFTILTIFQAASMLTYKYSVNSKVRAVVIIMMIVIFSIIMMTCTVLQIFHTLTFRRYLWRYSSHSPSIRACCSSP